MEEGLSSETIGENSRDLSEIDLVVVFSMSVLLIGLRTLSNVESTAEAEEEKELLKGD